MRIFQQLSMDTAEFALSELVGDARERACSLTRAERDKVHFLLDPSLPERVVGVPEQLDRLLTELLRTAIFSAESYPVRLSVFPGRERQTELEIAFEITSAAADRKGAAARPSETSEFAASVASLKRLAESLGGDLGYQVQNGVPAVFWCRIPVQQQILECDERSERPSSPGSSPGGASVVRILMAEDNSINQRVGKLILQRAGYKIDLVSDGNEAIEAHRNGPYHIILMDCQMPTMDGFEATRRIRSAELPQPVIIAVTANALVGERERCLSAGMDDYLSKPFQAEQLISMVEKWAATALAR